KKRNALAAAQRQALIDGFCLAVEDRGIGGATVIDIVRHARVSKRTFYEHFADKDACFIAAYRELAEQTMQAIASAVDTTAPWEEQLAAAITIYLEVLDSRPKLTRACFLGIHAAGPRGFTLRREVLERFAALVRGLVADARTQKPELRALTPAMATAMVGGMNELMLLRVEKQMRMGDLAETALTLWKAVVAPPHAGR
ncbi:MAG TPA: TetR/AcrR family transcriptional regulator, partial [Polyangia bacterium]|nr:TetR/AcrR family transcriptional regulator [Polyangia bacterium]